VKGDFSMEKGVILTSRDAILLRDLYDKTVMSFGQIHHWHFASKSVPTVSNRLKKLKIAGLIQAMQVGAVVHHQQQKRIGLIFRVTKKAIRFLQASFPKEKLKEDPVPFNTQTLVHDLLLNELLRKLKMTNQDQVILHGKLIHYEISKLERIPDAVIIDAITFKKMAVELELTVKSETRYRQIIMSYRLSRHYEKVLYITGNQSISDRLTYLITGFRRNDNLPPMPTGAFRITNLEEII
jgi:hypothetical protein